MMRATTVSIIIPTYNRAHLVGRAINSILAQTFQDFEIIVVDDGSEDNTSEVVRSFSDRRIKYLRHEGNRGVCAARNTGIKAAMGEYMAFLDSDDEFLPEKLQEQMAVFQGEAAANPHMGVVITGRLHYDDKRDTVVRRDLADSRGNLFEPFLRGEVGGNISMLVRKQCFEEVGLWDEELPASTVWDMCFRLATRFEYGAVEAPLYLVHVHEGPRAWTANNRREALTLLLAKHRNTLGRRPKLAAGLRMAIGADFLCKGLGAQARLEFLRSIRLNPYRPTGYLYFLLSLLGATPFRIIQAIKKRAILGDAPTQYGRARDNVGQ